MEIKTYGIAGDVLQKFTQYQMPLTIVGDFAKFNSQKYGVYVNIFYICT